MLAILYKLTSVVPVLMVVNLLRALVAQAIYLANFLAAMVDQAVVTKMEKVAVGAVAEPQPLL